MNDEANGAWPSATPQERVAAPPMGDSGQPGAPFGAPPAPTPGYPAPPATDAPAAWQSAPPPRTPDAPPSAAPQATPSAEADQEPIILVARMSDPVFVTTPATPAAAAPPVFAQEPVVAAPPVFVQEPVVAAPAAPAEPFAAPPVFAPAAPAAAAPPVTAPPVFVPPASAPPVAAPPAASWPAFASARPAAAPPAAAPPAGPALFPSTPDPIAVVRPVATPFADSPFSAAPSFADTQVPSFTDTPVPSFGETAFADASFAAPAFTDPEPVVIAPPTAANYFGDDQPFSSAPLAPPASLWASAAPAATAPAAASSPLASPPLAEPTSPLVTGSWALDDGSIDYSAHDDPAASIFADLLPSAPSAPEPPRAAATTPFTLDFGIPASDSASAAPAVSSAPASSAAQPVASTPASVPTQLSAADPFVGFGLAPSAPTTDDDESDGVSRLGLERRERVKRSAISPLDWAALVLAVLVAPIGLLASIAALVIGSRRNGWTTGVAKAALGISIAFTLVLTGVGIVAGNTARDQAAFDGIVAKSASWCSSITANPATLASDTYGWPAPTGSISANLKRMQTYADFWTALAKKAPTGIATETQKIADGATGIVANVKSSRVLNDSGNVSLMQQLVAASAIPDYVDTYCK